MTRSILVFILSAMMLLAGCCTKTALDGITTKSFSNCLDSGPVDFVCKPTDAQKAEAAKWLDIVDILQTTGSSFYPPLGIAKASAVMTIIKDGGCFLISELRQALNLIQTGQAKAAVVRGKPAPSVTEQFPALSAVAGRK